MKVLIIGLGSHHEFGLSSLKANGHIVGVIDMQNKIPTDLVDWYAASTLDDLVSIQQALQNCERKWDALLCWDELSVSIAHAVARSQNIPGPRMNTPAFRDKACARKKLSEAGLPSPQFFSVCSLQEAYEASTALPWPVIVKPTDYGGSSGVKLVKNEEELDTAYKAAVSKSLTSKCMVEEYIEGPEYSVETITWSKGRHLTLGITQKETTPPPFFVELGHIFPALLQECDAEEIVRITHRVLDILGMEAGASHTEVKLTPKGPVVIEVAGRLAGDFIPELVWMSMGMNPYTLELAAISRSEMPLVQQTRDEIVSAVKFFTAQPGTILYWPDVQKCLQNVICKETVQDVQYWYPAGIKTSTLNSNGRRLGCCIIMGQRYQVELAYKTAEKLGPL